MYPEITQRLLSAPLKLEWAGWETDTYKLQQAGWSLNANQDYAERRMRIAMEHKGVQMRAITYGVDYEYMMNTYGASGMRPPVYPTLPVHMMGRDVIIHEHGSIDWTNYKPIDATPNYVTQRISKLEDLVHFAAPLVRTKEIIIPQESVSELLDRILQMQQPERTERIREQIRNPEGLMLDAIPQQRFEAQIISLPMAA